MVVTEGFNPSKVKEIVKKSYRDGKPIWLRFVMLNKQKYIKFTTIVEEPKIIGQKPGFKLV